MMDIFYRRVRIAPLLCRLLKIQGRACRGSLLTSPSPRRERVDGDRVGRFSSSLPTLQGARAGGAMTDCVSGTDPWWVAACRTRQGSVGESGTQEYVSEPRCLLELLSLGCRLSSSSYSGLGLQALSSL